jgi:hypothetical protein
MVFISSLQLAGFKKRFAYGELLILSMPAALTLRAGRAVQMLKHLCFAKISNQQKATPDRSKARNKINHLRRRRNSAAASVGGLRHPSS